MDWHSIVVLVELRPFAYAKQCTSHGLLILLVGPALDIGL